MGVVDLEKFTTPSTPSTANTTEEIPWVEQTITGGFRIWQVLFLGGAVLLAISQRTSALIVYQSLIGILI